MTQTIVNLGTGGAALNGRNGSTGGADSNDALFLDWDGLDYVYLPGVASNFLSVPDEAALDITGDIDIRAYVALDDWTPAVNTVLLSKWNGSGSQSSFIFGIQTTGTISLWWTTTGTSPTLNRQSTVAPTIIDGTAKWVRATLDVDNGASGHDVKFFVSDDGLTWTQVGTTVTTAGVTSIFSGSSPVEIGTFLSGSTWMSAGKIYRAQVFNGIDGTKVLDVDTSVITSGAATSFTALTSQTVTINRGTAGRKTVAVVSPVWLFGTDDYMEVADNDLLDFGAADSFTVLAVVRQWATPVNTGRYVDKANATATDGWILASNGTAIQPLALLDSPAASSSFIAGSTVTAGTLAVFGFLNNGLARTVQAITNTTLSTTASTSTQTTYANLLPMRVGRLAGTGTNYQDFELLAVAVFRRALTATEISRITAYYQARLS